MNGGMWRTVNAGTGDVVEHDTEDAAYQWIARQPAGTRFDTDRWIQEYSEWRAVDVDVTSETALQSREVAR